MARPSLLTKIAAFQQQLAAILTEDVPADDSPLGVSHG